MLLELCKKQGFFITTISFLLRERILIFTGFDVECFYFDKLFGS